MMSYASTPPEHGLALAAPAPTADVALLAAAVRVAVAYGRDWAGTADLVAEQIARHLPTPDVLTATQRLGLDDRDAGGAGSSDEEARKPGECGRVMEQTGLAHCQLQKSLPSLM